MQILFFLFVSAMSTRQEIVVRIKAFVKEKGWTVQQFADKMILLIAKRLLTYR